MRTLALWPIVLLPVSFATRAVEAAEFWTATPYTEWSEKEVQKLLTNSPWARSVSVHVDAPPSSNAVPMGPSARQPNVNSGPGPGPMDDMGTIPAGTRKPGDPPSANGQPGALDVRVIVRWQSALPVKQALLVRKGRNDLTSPEEAQRILNQPETHYVVAMLGVPLKAVGDAAEARARFQAATSLRRKGKDPIAPERVEMISGARTVDLYFLFPRTNSINADDKEVEFASRVGPAEVKTKFRLKEMVVGDKLAL